MSEEKSSVELIASDGSENKENFLIEREKLLAAGIHIGTKLKTNHSENWIYRTTNNGLYVINLENTDKRIRIAAKSLQSLHLKDPILKRSTLWKTTREDFAGSNCFSAFHDLSSNLNQSSNFYYVEATFCLSSIHT